MLWKINADNVLTSDCGEFSLGLELWVKGTIYKQHMTTKKSERLMYIFCLIQREN